MKKKEKPKTSLKDIMSDEISLVPKGANRFPFLLIKRQTPISKGAIQYKEFEKAPEDYQWDGSAAVQRLQIWASTGGSGEKETIDWEKYKTAFLWYDAEDDENFKSYKMPVLDIIDDSAKVVWNAVVAAFAAIQGARGGVDIPIEDREEVLARLKQHYTQFEKEWPLVKSEASSFSENLNQSVSVPFLKIEEGKEERLATGIVLVPGKVDGQKDIASNAAVKKAAHEFLIRRQETNNDASLGVLHKFFNKNIQLVESYVAPVDMNVNNRSISKGTWIVTFKILDEETWCNIKKGNIRGFSIQGKGRGRRL